MRLAIGIPEQHVSAEVLNAGLETNTRLNEQLLDNGEVPTAEEGIARGIRWKPEPPGEERFDHAKTVMQRGWGDCDDLAPWQAASLRATGEDPDAEAIAVRSGPNRWHAIVRRSDGRLEDPSRAAGMGRIQGARPATLPVLFPRGASVVGSALVPDVRPSLSTRTVGAGWWEGRADAPWKDTPYALSSLNRSPTAKTALVGAIMGALVGGEAAECMHPETARRLAGIAALLHGDHPEDIAAVLGADVLERSCYVAHHMGFSFGKIFHAFEPLASKLISFVPGVGPIASTALDIANAVTTPGGKIPPIPGVPADVQASIVNTGIALHPASPPQKSPAPVHLEHLPPHIASIEAYPGGPAVMRF